MKTTGNNSDVCHFWANKTQEQMRNANGSLYFEGETIYSYGSHFPIARHMNPSYKFINGNIILFTTRTYSNTTAKHMSDVRQSIPTGQNHIFYVPNVIAHTDNQHTDNFNDYVERYNDKLKEAARSRKHTAYLMEEAYNLAQQSENYKSVFNLVDCVSIDTDAIDMDAIKQELKEAAKLKKIATAEMKKQNLIDAAEKIKDWRNGFKVFLPRNLDCMLRLSDDGEKIQTSQGADIPTTHAKKLWRLICLTIKKGKAYSGDLKVGFYHLNRIDVKGNIVVGCHSIKYNELLMIAKQLNFKGI